MSRCLAFLDTNIFLHFQPFDQIDWPEVLNAEQVTLVLALPVMQELDEQKDQHRLSKIRERARKALRKIEQLDADAKAVSLPEGVSVRTALSEADLDFPEHGLDQTVPDDRLVASCLAEREATPDAKVALVTDDTTPRMKARHHGLHAVEMPDEYRLPDALSDAEKKNQRLRRQVQKLKHQSPSLDLTFEDGQQYVTRSLIPPGAHSEEKMAERLAAVREKHPKKVLPTDDDPSGDDSLKGSIPALQQSLRLMEGLNRPSPEAVGRYNEELDEFYEAYEGFLRRRAHYKARQLLTVQLEILLVNDGTWPAKDIDVFMHFPDGFTLCTEEDLPDRPEKPQPPPAPSPRGLGLNIDAVVPPIPTHRTVNPASIPSPGRSNVSAPSIEKTNSYDVEFGVGKLKQHMDEACDPLFVVFHSYEAASSFGIDYRINAANLPEEVEGRLNVVIEKE